jgi:2'-5' RNA ligase
MRLFTAIAVPAEIRERLTELVGVLEPTASIQWSPPDNWHITTKFIGDWADLAGIEKELATVRVPPFSVEVRGLGWYPNQHQPRVLFAGVAAPEELGDLHEQTDGACARLGVAKETKRYSPHLTLARIRMSEPVSALRQAISELPSIEFGQFRVESFWLYVSRAEARGSVYQKIKEFPLG